MGHWKNQGKLLQSQKLMVCLFYGFFFLRKFSLLKVFDCGCTFFAGRLFCTVGVHPTRCNVSFFAYFNKILKSSLLLVIKISNLLLELFFDVIFCLSTRSLKRVVIQRSIIRLFFH